MTNDLNNNDLEKPPELMLEFKIKKDGPYEFALDVIDNKLFVIDILPGGIIHRHGGLLIDDELVELNGAKFDAENFYECIHMLETALEDKTSVSYFSLFFKIFYFRLTVIFIFFELRSI